MVKISKIEKPKTAADFSAFRAAAGSWEKVDTETFNDLILITRNKKDFQKVEGLELFSENH